MSAVQLTDAPSLAVAAERPGLGLVWVQATTPMAPPPATAAIASTAQTTRQQAQSALVITHAQALAQPLLLAPAMTGTTPPLTLTAQAVDSRAMFQAPLSTRPLTDRALALVQAQAMTGTTPPLAPAVVTEVARPAVGLGMAAATLGQGMTGTIPPLAPAVVTAAVRLALGQGMTGTTPLLAVVEA